MAKRDRNWEVLTCLLHKSQYNARAITPPQIQTSKPCTTVYLRICLVLPSELWWKPPHILNQKPRLSISSQNTPNLNSLICSRAVEKEYFKTKERKCERAREREMNRWEKNNLLDLKFFNVLLLHLEMRLFRVAAGPCDLRMNINVTNFFFRQSNSHVNVMWLYSKMCSCRIYLKEEGLFKMRVAGFLLYLCFLLVRPEETLHTIQKLWYSPANH